MAPIFLATVLAVSIFFGQFLAVAGVVAGAGVILLIVRWANPRDEPFREVLEIVLHNQARDAAWMNELRQKQRDASKTTIRSWWQYAVAVWIVLAALIVKLGYLGFVEFYKPS